MWWVRESKTYLVCDKLESHASGVEGGGLLGVTDPEANVVKAVEYSNFGLAQQ